MLSDAGKQNRGILPEQPPFVPVGYPNIQHSHPSCALWLFCALRSQISHDATQIKHNSGFFGLGLSISFLHSYRGSIAAQEIDLCSCWCIAVPFLLADLAFFHFCPAFAPSLGLGFHDASTPFCRLGFHIRLDCFGLSRLLLVQLLLVHSSTLLLRSSCASARRNCWCVAGAVGSLAAAPLLWAR